MNDYKELIENLREEADAVQAIEWDIPICTSNHIAQAADAIARLIAENARLKAELDETREDELNAEKFAWKMKAERDAAVNDLQDLNKRYIWR